jgi:DNA modification methylase
MVAHSNRDGTGAFSGDCGKCGAVRIDRQLGLESTPDLYVAAMVDVFREVRRVLKADGTLWLNLGDSYTSGGRDKWNAGDNHLGQHGAQHGMARAETPAGLKPKDLVGIPWRVAFALQADGWWLRSDIIWAKPNPMPESVTDRPTKAHEYIFLLSRSERYYYDADAIRERAVSGPSDLRKMAEQKERIGGLTKDQTDPRMRASSLTNMGRKRSVGGAPLDKQAAAAAARPDCGRTQAGFNARWDASEKAKMRAEGTGVYPPNRKDSDGVGAPTIGRNIRTVWEIATTPYPGAHFATFPPELARRCILAGCPPGGIVLDPFVGSGTTVMVARQLGREGIGLDINSKYLDEQAAQRIKTDRGFAFGKEQEAPS